MTACQLSPFVRSVVGLAVITCALSVSKPHPVFGQDANSRQNKCAVSEILKPAKTVPGTYTEEATKKNAEGTVVLCATVDGHGKVTDVSPLSGPAELLQLSMDAARQWQFETPPKAPAFTQIQMQYSLTKPCPEGKGYDAGDIVVTIVPTNAEKVDDLKILGKLTNRGLSILRRRERSGEEGSFTFPSL